MAGSGRKTWAGSCCEHRPALIILALGDRPDESGGRSRARDSCVALAQGIYFGLDGRPDCSSIFFLWRWAGSRRLAIRLIEAHALLARAAVDIAQNVDRRRHGVVDADAASNGHARYRDRRRLRPVVDGRDESGFQKFCLAGRRQFAARQQPDHFGEADSAQLNPQWHSRDSGSRPGASQ